MFRESVRKDSDRVDPYRRVCGMVPNQGDEALRSMPSIPEYLIGDGAMACGASQSEAVNGSR
jgi:hypothetical protein